MSLMNIPKESKFNYPVVEGDEIGKLIITPHLQEQIDIFHAFAGSIEWSGILLYTIDKGDISNPDELVITAKAMFPMDIGTAAYTEYDYGPEVMDMYDMYPKALEEGWILGHIHTHHNMKAYFSGTDTQELRDNIDNHSNYLSLIVNFKKEYCAKICKKGSRKVESKSLTTFSSLISDKISTQETDESYEEEIVFAINLTIEMPTEEENKEVTFFSRLLKLKEEASSNRWTPVTKRPGHSSLYTGSTSQLNIWGDDEDNKFSKDSPQYKNVVEFVFKLLSVDLNKVVSEEADPHLEIKSMMRKYNNMTETDKAMYLDYIDTNIPKIIEKTLHNKMELLDSAMDLLAIYSSKSYGYNSYESDHMIDEILIKLEDYDFSLASLPN